MYSLCVLKIHIGEKGKTIAQIVVYRYFKKYKIFLEINKLFKICKEIE